MMTSPRIALTAVVGTLVVLTGCTAVKTAKDVISGQAGEILNIQDVQYRKKGSIDSRLGRVGTFEGKSFQPFEQVKLPDGVVGSSYEISLGEVEKWGLNVVKDWLKTGRIEDENAKAGKYLIVRADTVELTKAMNTPQNEGILKEMIDREDPKVIVSFLTVISDVTTRTTTSEVTIFDDGSVNVGGKTEATQKLGENTPAAFSTADVCWKVVDGQPKVTQLVLDYKNRGSRSGCPDGSTKSTASIRKKLQGQ